MPGVLSPTEPSASRLVSHNERPVLSVEHALLIAIELVRRRQMSMYVHDQETTPTPLSSAADGISKRRTIGTRALIKPTTPMTARPPVSTASSGPSHWPTAPARNWPSCGPPFVKTALTELTRPRTASGMLSCKIVPRSTVEIVFPTP